MVVLLAWTVVWAVVGREIGEGVRKFAIPQWLDVELVLLVDDLSGRSPIRVSIGGSNREIRWRNKYGGQVAIAAVAVTLREEQSGEQLGRMRRNVGGLPAEWVGLGEDHEDMVDGEREGLLEWFGSCGVDVSQESVREHAHAVARVIVNAMLNGGLQAVDCRLEPGHRLVIVHGARGSHVVEWWTWLSWGAGIGVWLVGLFWIDRWIRRVRVVRVPAAPERSG
jgi:hypothetical protein